MSTNTSVFGLFEYDPATDGNLPFNITQALNNNWNKIDSLVLPVAAAAAPYNPSGTYSIGDYCIYNGTLQKCNTPIPSGEVWNAAHWAATTVAAELIKKTNGLVGNVQSLGYTKIADITENGSYLIFAGPSFLSDYPEQLSKDGLDYCVLRVTNCGSYITYDIIATNASSTEFGFAFGFRKSNGVAWRRSGDTTPPQVRNLTLQSGFTADGDCTFFVTQESTVFLAGGVSGSLPANQDTQIGTLPADAIPDAQCRRPAVTDVGTAYIDIHTDGTVWAHPFSAASQCWFSAPFVAGGGS